MTAPWKPKNRRLPSPPHAVRGDNVQNALLNVTGRVFGTNHRLPGKGISRSPFASSVLSVLKQEGIPGSLRMVMTAAPEIQ